MSFPLTARVTSGELLGSLIRRVVLSRYGSLHRWRWDLSTCDWGHDKRIAVSRSHWRFDTVIGVKALKARAPDTIGRVLEGLVKRALRADALDARDPLFAAHVATGGGDP